MIRAVRWDSILTYLKVRGLSNSNLPLELGAHDRQVLAIVFMDRGILFQKPQNRKTKMQDPALSYVVL